MSRFWLVLAATLAWAQAPTKTIAFTHVTVINAAAGTAEPDMTVVVNGARIVEVGKTAAVKPPASAQLVAVHGKYLIPGLWDMHAHQAPDSIPLYLANGVTGVRSTNDDLEAIQKSRDQIASGELIGPRIYFCGPFVDGPQRPRPSAVAVTTPEQGREAVDNLKKRGVDFIKVYNDLSREAYFAIAAEASDAGQKSIEHLSQVVLGCSREEARLRELSARSPQQIRTSEGTVLAGQPVPVETYDAEKAKALFEKFAKNGTWHTPTFTVLRVRAYWKDPGTIQDARSEYVPARIRQSWKRSPFVQLVNSLSPTAEAALRKLFELELEVVGRMHRAGVGILAGTDSSIPYIVQGFSLHNELQWLVKAGLTPPEALQAATIRPAEYFGITDSAGTIAKGKLADLVLLNADPLKDIANTQKIESVMVSGYYLVRGDLDRMLEKLKADAAPMEQR